MDCGRLRANIYVRISGDCRDFAGLRALISAPVPIMEIGTRELLIQPFKILPPTDRHIEIRNQAIGQRINPAMDMQTLAALPGFLYEDVGCDVSDLANDVELAQAIESGLRIR